MMQLCVHTENSWLLAYAGLQWHAEIRRKKWDTIRFPWATMSHLFWASKMTPSQLTEPPVWWHYMIFHVCNDDCWLEIAFSCTFPLTYLILVGGLEHEFYFSIYIYIHIYIYGNVIIPADELIFFRGVGIPGQPPTSILLWPWKLGMIILIYTWLVVYLPRKISWLTNYPLVI